MIGNKIIISLASIIIVPLYPWATTMHVYNNTPYTFLVDLKQIGGELPSHLWGAIDKTIMPYKSAEILGCARNVGVKHNKEFIVAAMLTFDVNQGSGVDRGQTISLVQRVRGKTIGSKLWWGFSFGSFDNVWYDGNGQTWGKPKTFPIKTAKGDVFIQVKCKSDYWVGKKDPYDDLKYVLSMPDAPSKANYDEGFYLTSHNAYATTTEGYRLRSKIFLLPINYTLALED